MENLKFASSEEALQHLSDLTGKRIIIAASLDKELSSVEVYKMLQKDTKVIAWLWDKNNTDDFVKGGKNHFSLAEKIVKKNNLAKGSKEQEEKAEDIADSAVRGYYFPSSNEIAIYPIKSGFRYIDPKSDILNLISNKLGGNAKRNIKGIAIQDAYYV